MKKDIDDKLFKLNTLKEINKEFKRMQINLDGKLSFNIQRLLLKYTKIELDKILETLERQSLRNNQLMGTFMNYIAISLTVLTMLSSTVSLIYTKDETTKTYCYDKITKSEKNDFLIGECESSVNVHMAKIVTESSFLIVGFFFLCYLVFSLMKENKEHKKIIYYTFIVKRALDRIE